MWPPQRVKTWRTPACRRVRATSCPPVRSAMSSLAARSARPESRDDLGGDRFVLGALVARIADGAHDEVVAAGGPEPLERSEERRVGKEGRAGGWGCGEIKK